MTTSSLLISFNKFGWAEWGIFGLFVAMVLYALIEGFKTGFTSVKMRTLSWAFGCAVFLLLEKFFHDRCFISKILGTMSERFADPAYASFAASITWMIVALLVRWVVFGCISVVINKYKTNLLKKADKIARQEKETGEEYLPDENKVYKPLPIDGVIKPGPLNRLFGAICSAFSAAAIGVVLIAVSVSLLRQLPLYEAIKPHSEGGLESVWALMKNYALDIVLMTIAGAIIIKGYKDGILNGISTVGISLVKVIAIAGAMYLPFSLWTVEGGAFDFLTIGAVNLSSNIAIPFLPTVGKVLIVKLGFSVVLAVCAWIAVKLLGIACNRMMDYVDENPALWRVDGVIGALTYAIIMLAVIALILVAIYSLEYIGKFPATKLFTENSTITTGAFGVLDVTLKPVLEYLRGIFTM